MVRGCGNQACSLGDITGKCSGLNHIFIRCRGRLDGILVPAHRSDLAVLGLAVAMLGPVWMDPVYDDAGIFIATVPLCWAEKQGPRHVRWGLTRPMGGLTIPPAPFRFSFLYILR